MVQFCLGKVYYNIFPSSFVSAVAAVGFLAVCRLGATCCCTIALGGGSRSRSWRKSSHSISLFYSAHFRRTAFSARRQATVTWRLPARRYFSATKVGCESAYIFMRNLAPGLTKRVRGAEISYLKETGKCLLYRS